ncbi:MAG: acyltransferase [bacterium]|nr:acyltransferase [bacterium]
MKQAVNNSLEEYGSYDILKLILSILIIAINIVDIGLGSDNFYITQYVARLAVPLFFCMSASFLFRNYNIIDKSEFDRKFLTYEKNLLKMFVIWNIIYLFVDKIPEWYRTKSSVVEILKYIYYVTIGIQYKELWFVGASIVGSLIIWLLLKKFKIRTIVIMSFVLYLVALFCFTYYPVTKPIFDKNAILYFALNQYNRFFSTFRNGVFDAFPFMALGAYFALNRQKNYSTIAVFSVFAVSMVLLLFETQYLRSISTPYHGLMLFLYTATPSAFLLVGRIRLKPSPKYRFIRKISTYNFLVQEISFIIVRGLCKRLDFPIGKFLQFVLAVAICIVFSIIIIVVKKQLTIKLKEKKKTESKKAY